MRGDPEKHCHIYLQKSNTALPVRQFKCEDDTDARLLDLICGQKLLVLGMRFGDDDVD